jgi:hypothetical protein
LLSHDGQGPPPKEHAPTDTVLLLLLVWCRCTQTRRAQTRRVTSKPTFRRSASVKRTSQAPGWF